MASLQRTTHLNWMAGPSYALDDARSRLRMAASSCFFGEPMYYQRDAGGKGKTPRRHRPASRLSDKDVVYLRETLNAIDPQEWRGMGPAEMLESAIDAALDQDAEWTLQEAVRLRQELHLRTTPQVILVRAARHPQVRGTGLIKRYAPQILSRADEPAVGLAYQLETYGKPVPNALKRAWRRKLEACSAYELAKYRLEGRRVKTVDVVNMVHPRGEVIDQLVKGELRNTDNTWEAIVSAQGSNRQAWEQGLEVMGHMALLRNLRNLRQAGVEPERFTERLVAGAATGKQLPFRYYSAWKSLPESEKAARSAVEACLEESVGHLPSFGGRVMSLVDHSGSATGTTTSSMGTMKVSSIGSLTGVLAAMRADQGQVGVFGDRLECVPVTAEGSVLGQVERMDEVGRTIGGGTENGVWLFWDQAIRERQHWDTVFVFSDMQAGHGGLYGTKPKQYREYAWRSSKTYIDVPKLIRTYRERVNPRVLVFLVQIAGYQDSIVPEFYEGTFILGGWGSGLLQFAAKMAEL